MSSEAWRQTVALAERDGLGDALVARAPGELGGAAVTGARRAARSVRVLFRAARILGTSRELPVVLRVLLIVGAIQIPCSPVDEIALCIALPWLLIFHRETMSRALAEARSRT